MREYGELESAFMDALQGFAAGDMERQSDLFRAYNRLTASLSAAPDERDGRLRLICCALIEQLDAAPDGEISRILHLYTFTDFLEQFGSEPAVRQAIREYADGNRLNKLPLRIALGMRRTV